MRSVQDFVEAAIAGGAAPGAVVMVGDSSGTVHASAHGRRGPRGPAMGLDATFRLFSMTKAVASVAAMRLVEEGSLDLDGPVGELLPDFDDLQVLEGFDGETPILRPAASRATVRQLMTHTAGPVYEMWSAEQRRYLKASGLPGMGVGARDSFRAYPLAFDPGTRFGYGVSTDWLGRVIEEASGERVDGFLAREVLAPLGMSSTSVECSPEMSGRLVASCARGEDGFAPIDAGPPEQPEVWCMGQALYGTAPDYLRFLRMLLNKGALDGARVLSEEGVEVLLGDHTDPLLIPPFKSVSRLASADIDFFPGIAKSHSLMAMRVNQDVPGRRRAGSNGWAGLMNTHFWVDPASGICAVLMMQHLPFMEPGAAQLLSDVEAAVYAELG
ncbi:serine hydrolase domain-containing protein [Rhodovulum sp. DZ06]|uniref:serine hydrolase domain-containing protein n=1 Tax=Rhodovulum sp. DZ06 TaxID=3425126 RepID=UPI003D339F94